MRMKCGVQIEHEDSVGRRFPEQAMPLTSTLRVRGFLEELHFQSTQLAFRKPRSSQQWALQADVSGATTRVRLYDGLRSGISAHISRTQGLRTAKRKAGLHLAAELCRRSTKWLCCHSELPRH